ncbi:PAS domain S-box protein [Rugamonas sp.]|uniref:PAS domain S-box protein n=1 Tax=Rugamonas sp. TaxID=1926287 RepID=UPI0025CBD56E|nr:PAS domain S-box protein [Rugamonas sp.]
MSLHQVLCLTFAAHRRRLAALLCACVFGGVLGHARAAQVAATAPAAPTRSVLVLASTNYGNTGIELYISSMMRELNAHGVPLVDIHVEALDLLRYPQAAYREQLRQLLAVKYAGRRVDAVVVLQLPALSFILHEGRMLAPHAPVLAALTAMPPEVADDTRDFVFQLPRLDFAGTLRRALELYPATRRVMVLSGASEIERQRLPDIRRQLAPWRDRLAIDYSDGRPLDQVVRQLAAAPPDTIAISSGYSRDDNGQVYVPGDSLRRMAALSRAPVFTFYETSLGPNVLGGMMADFTATGADMARAVLSTAPRAHVSELPTAVRPYFDLRQMRLWRADPDRLPAGTVFVNRPVTLWSQYRYFVVASGVTIVLLSAMLLALAWQNRRRRAAERAQALSEAHYRRQIEQAPEAIVVVDFDQRRILDANPSAERLFGVDRATLTASWITDYYAPLQPDGRSLDDSMGDHLEQALAGQEILFERNVRTADGRIALCEVRVATMGDPQRQITRASMVDITERRRQEQLTRQLLAENQTMLRNAMVGICHLKDRRFVSCNRKLEQLFGYGPGEMNGLSTRVYYVTDADYEATGALIYPQLATGLNYGAEMELRRKDGSVFWSEVAGCAIDPARPQDGSIWIYSDVTERRLAQQELLAHRDHLEELVDQRTAAMVAALGQAEAANRAKSTFLANMSHELRTPLNAVIGFSRLMARAGTLSDEQRRNLEIINRAGNHLLTLINEVLTLSKIDAGHLQLSEEETDPRLLLNDVVELLHGRATQAGLTLALEMDGLPAAVRVDAIKLRQVLLNLVSNAIKFTARGGVRLLAHAHGAAREDGAVAITFEVIDSGIGVAQADQLSIFEPFVQMNTPARNAGTGLGLAISRQYLQLMGGALTLESTPGLGARFCFTLTLMPAQSTAAPDAMGADAPLPTAAAQGRRILIAEDNPDARLLLQQLLRPLGFELAEAHDGLAAVALAATFAPELIIIDWRMPGIDGLEAVRRIRADVAARRPQERPPYFVMLTATAFAEQEREAVELGVHTFLRKPLQETALYAALEQGLCLRFERARDGRGAAPGDAARNGVNNSPPLTRAALAVLPEALREALQVAVRELNQARMAAVIALIGEQDGALAAAIGAMAAAFQCRELDALLQREPVRA